MESRLNNKNQENRRLQSSLNVHKNRERNEEEEEKSRDHYINESKLSSWMDTEVINTALRIFDIYSSDFDRAKHIASHFKDEYGGYWSCSVGKFCNFYQYCWYRNDHFIDIRIGNREIYLFENYR